VVAAAVATEQGSAGVMDAEVDVGVAVTDGRDAQYFAAYPRPDPNIASYIAPRAREGDHALSSRKGGQGY